MRRIVLVGVTLGIAVLSAAPALAAPPEISQKNCDAAGGTFARDQGVKTCTTSTTDQFTTPPTSLVAWFGSKVGGEEYTGVSTRTDVIQTTTQQSQKGNGDVTTTQSSSVISSTVTPMSCTLEQTILDITTVSHPSFDVCAAKHVYLTPTPLGPIV